MVDDVDAVLDERAFAPAHGLAADAQLRGQFAEIELRVGEGIEQAHVTLDQLLRLGIERCAFGVVGRVVVERRGAYEGTDTAVVQRQLRERLDGAAVHVGAVVEIAVVDVRRATATAIGDGDEPAVTAFDAPGLAVGERGIPAARERAFVVLEIPGLRGGCKAKQSDQTQAQTRARHAATPDQILSHEFPHRPLAHCASRGGAVIPRDRSQVDGPSSCCLGAAPLSPRGCSGDMRVAREYSSGSMAER
jgi:hypothetical protein